MSPRLAKGRETYLTSEEISREILSQFDSSSRPPTIRSLASALNVSPASLYHHFSSEDEIIRHALSLVFEEAFAEYIARAPDLAADISTRPDEVLVGAAVAFRRAFARHYQIAVHLPATAESSPRLSGMLAFLGGLVENLGLSGPVAGEAIFAYGHYVYGSVLMSSSRRIANDRLSPSRQPFSIADDMPDDAPAMTAETTAAFDRALGDTAPGTEAEEEMFVAGLRMLIRGMAVGAGEESGGSR